MHRNNNKHRFTLLLCVFLILCNLSAKAFSTHRPLQHRRLCFQATALYANPLKSFVSRVFRRRRKRQVSENEQEENDKSRTTTGTTNNESAENALEISNDRLTLEDDKTPLSSVLLDSNMTSPITRSTTTTTTDLSGSWKLLVNETFLQQYEQYLIQLGQPFWVRSIALSIVARTTEQTKQTSNGESLWIQGTNVRGTWERTLLTTTTTAAAANATLFTADGELVQYEAWWEGPVHVSWLHGVQKYGGGSFESRRYLVDTGLVCESTFHPVDPSREAAHVKWTFVPA